jgi:putative hydrolase of the HAD superfamily
MATPLKIQAIAFDADDTLWHNEDDFAVTEELFADLLAPWSDREVASRALLETETRNLALFGYGVKSFTLSMIEAAMELSGGAIDPITLAQLLQRGKDMLARPAELLDGVEQVINDLAMTHELLVITKGDLHHQESKTFHSGIAHHFRGIEVVAEKNTLAYERILDRYDIDPRCFVMVGNSAKSDIIPPLQLGSVGVHIPYVVTWEHEQLSESQRHKELGAHSDRFFALQTIVELPELLDRLQRGK